MKLTETLKLSKAFILWLFVILSVTFACDEEDDGVELKADFTYEIVEDNNVVFTNNSTGEYYSLTWDFGNDQTETTTDKKKTFRIYYAHKGDYDVSLKVLAYSGSTKTITKSITIAEDDIQIAFTAQISQDDPNRVILTNTTTGTYDSFVWLYNFEEVEDEMHHTAYFPYSGIYEIELQVTKNNITFSKTQNITIAQDDPDYIADMTLVWSDEFDANPVNTQNWTFETGTGDWGWGNNELQNYTNGNNAEIVGGKLIITARKVNDLTETGSYTSTRMITRGKKEFRYGRIEIKAKLPAGKGVWPAIWMLGANLSTVGWPACGEIDIMEYVGYEPNTVHSTVHTTAGSGGNGSGSSKTLTTCEEEFHIYGLIWTAQSLIFYTDTPESVTHTYAPATKTAENWPFNEPQFFIFNLAIGGTWGGAQGIDNTIFPQTLEIDYVRVYQ